MRSLISQSFLALRPFRRLAITSITLQMLAVAMESVALLALGSLFAILLQDDTISGILELPEKILTYFGFEMRVTDIFLMVLVLLAFKGVLQSLSIYVGNIVSTGYQKRVIDDLAEAYSFADWNYLASQKSSKMLNLMFVESSRATDTLMNLLKLATAALSAGVYLFFAVLVSPVSVGIFALAFMLFALLLYPLLRLIKRDARVLVEVRARLAQKVEELLSGVKIVKALGSEERVHQQIKSDSEQIRRLDLYIGLLRESTSASDIGIIIAVFVLFILHVTGLSEALDAGVIGVMLLRMSQRSQVVIASVGPLVEGLPSLETTASTLSTLRHNRERDGRKIPAGNLSSLSFKNVSYSYDGRSDVLSSIKFDIKNGEFVGIVGESGGGKTTIVDLILGLLDPTEGRIVVDDLDLSELKRLAWRQQIGYVSQDATLFHDTIYNNISAYRPDVSKEDVHWAANIAQASEFIEGFELGYDHVVGDRGIRLSGGQRQRLSLARALAARPSFLLLDEATSSLDSNAEHEFQMALENIRSQMTIIAIAHRIPTVLRADRVIVIADQTIVETGSPVELLKIPGGRFATLHTIQSATIMEADSAPENSPDIT
jgi:ATP-binding cassette, subfamily C, bacterial